jgi:uncharacterized protein (DUF1800 family)
LLQAAFGGNDADIEKVQRLGFAGWLDEQFSVSGDISHWDWMVASGNAVVDNVFGFKGVDNTLWRKYLSSPDALRQRVALALSEIFVVSMSGLPIRFRGMVLVSYADILADGAFGSYRQLIERITLSPAMGVYLSMRGSQREDAASGRQPDENYAREVLQLFSIGLARLNMDGTSVQLNGQTQETYTNADISGLARVFTGWDFDGYSGASSDPAFARKPMVVTASRHSLGSKAFLGVNIAANAAANGAAELTIALDAISAHPNVAPFLSRQMIQRLVTSNPSPAYVARVATAFKDSGLDFKAMLRALFLDSEARQVGTGASAGMLRPPMLRFMQWARVFKATSPTGKWDVGDTSSASSRLGQSPFRSPSVFNFYRPGYTPPNSELGRANLQSPELQITHESSVTAYANWMQGVVANGIGEVRADYSALISLADNPANLVAKIALWLAADRISAPTLDVIANATASIAISSTNPATAATDRSRRIHAAVLLVMTCPEFLVMS